MYELLFGSGTSPLLAYGKQYPSHVWIGVLVLAQFAILALHMMFGDKRSSRGTDGGDIGGWDFGDGDGDTGGCGD
jgi:hypothetical protein